MNAVLAHPLPHEAPTFEQQVRPLLPGLRARALQLTRSPAEADDLLQDAILRAWRFRTQYREGKSLRAWLSRILTNTFINGYRRARREREVVARLGQSGAMEPQGEPAPDAALLAGTLSEELQGSLAELPSDFREVLWKVAVDDLSYGEAADALGCPIGTVMSRLHRARRNLKSSLGPYASTRGYC
ncbi:MAG: sigma-70 family RNA polymerase sigma factor [Myxococcales bacterium]|nr:sigma-70 family RNA polymerase sigma factor [Myxococcales bacterium]